MWIYAKIFRYIASEFILLKKDPQMVAAVSQASWDGTSKIIFINSQILQLSTKVYILW